MHLNEKLKRIKLLLLDVDGVLTDGSIIVGNSDQELKVFNIQDGFGIKLAQNCGIQIGIITGRTSEAVEKRANELKIEILFQGYQDKLEAYEKIKNNFKLKDDQVAYIGDDLPDLKLMQKVGVSFAVINACDEVKHIADYVTQRPGGKGAVREMIELILKNQGKWESSIQKYHESH